MSRLLRDFQIRGIEDHVKDDFDDGSIHSRWTKDEVSPAVITEESAGYLQIADTSGTYRNWSANFNSPNVYTDVKGEDFFALVHVSNILAVQHNWAGMVHYHPFDETTAHKIDLYYEVGGAGKLRAGWIASMIPYTWIGNWIAMVRRGSYMHFGTSNNTVDNEPSFEDLTIVRTVAHQNFFPGAKIALYSGKTGTFPDTEHRFQKFRIYYP